MLLRVENLTTYYGKIMALDNVSIDISEGEVVAVIGRNGAGKTTLLRSIMGLVKPAKGRILFRGEDITGKPPWIRAKLRIGYVPEGRRLFPYLTVEENLLVGAYTLKDKEEIYRRLKAVYRLFPRLEERRSQLARTLSGGEAQMLAIGRGLMVNPRILLMDEPSMGLAPKIVDEVFDTISSLKEKEKVTILLVEQNARKALEVADRVYLLDTGRVVLHARADEARNDPRVRKIYLGG